MRMTIICAAGLVDDANQLLRVFGHGPADGDTFGAPTLQDGAGNAYALASGTLAPVTALDLTGPLHMPLWGADMAAAARAQAALRVFTAPVDGASLPDLGLNSLLVLEGVGLSKACAFYGLTPPQDVQEEEL